MITNICVAQMKWRGGNGELELTNYDKPIYIVNHSENTQDTAGNAFTKWGLTKTGATEE